MEKNELKIQGGEKTIAVTFAAFVVTKELSSRVTLDFDASGELIAIELLDLLVRVGEDAGKFIEQKCSAVRETPYCAYDKAADALSIRIKEGASSSQSSVDGRLLLDTDGRIVGLKATWS